MVDVNILLFKVIVYVQRENFWISNFLDENKLPSRFLQNRDGEFDNS